MASATSKTCDGGPAATGRSALMRTHRGHLKNGVPLRIAATP
jgi:hypothetical protein